MDSLQYIKLLALMATTLLGDVLPEGDLDLNSKENPAEGVVLDHDGDGDVVVVILVLMEGILVVSIIKLVLVATIQGSMSSWPPQHHRKAIPG